MFGLPDEEDEFAMFNNVPSATVQPAMPETAPTAQPMRPEVKDYLAKKFNLGQYASENRDQVNEGESPVMNGLAAALAGVSAGFQGRDTMGAVSGVLDQQNKAKQARFAEFDKDRANKIQDYSLDREVAKNERDDALIARESDPNSQESKMATDLATAMGYKGGPLTAAQFKSFSPVMQKKYEIEQRKLDRQESRDERRYLAGERRSDKQAVLDEKRQNKELELAVPGFERTGEVLPKVEEAQKFRKATATAGALQQKLKRMQELVAKHGSFEYGGNGGTEMSTLATEIQLLGKSPELYELGVLTGPDLGMLEKISASPDSWSSLFTRDGSRQKQLDTQMQSLQQKLGATAKSLGYASKESPEAPQTKVVGGVTYRKVNGGWEEIPMPASR